MVGGIVMVIVVLLVMPPLIMLAGAAWSAIVGQLASDDADRRAA
jgi:hypothetical protein